MSARKVTLFTVCLVLAGSTLSAEAAPKRKAAPACNLVQDAKGDATQLGPVDAGLVPNEPSVDILSADIASNGKKMTTVLRVDKLAEVSPGSPYGNYWDVFFTAGGTVFYARAESVRDIVFFSLGYSPTSISTRRLHEATGVFDLARNEVRVTFTLADLALQAPNFKPGSTITGLRGQTNRQATFLFSPRADEAVGTRSYVEGSPSCVKVGK